MGPLSGICELSSREYVTKQGVLVPNYQRYSNLLGRTSSFLSSKSSLKISIL